MPTDRDFLYPPGSPFAAGPWIDASEHDPPDDDFCVLIRSRGGSDWYMDGGHFVDGVWYSNYHDPVTHYAIINAPEGP